MSRRRVIIIVASLFLTVGIIFAAGLREDVSSGETPEETTASKEAAASLEAAEAALNRAELLTNALAAAYAGRIEKAEFRDDDWAVLLDGVWYYYAGGRLLPTELLDTADDYSPINFYNYRSELPPLGEYSAEQIARFRAQYRNGNRTNTGGERPAVRRQRSNSFHEALWRAHDRAEASSRVKTVNFLGKSLTVHSDIAAALVRVETLITIAAKSDPGLQTWINNIGEVHGWNWRTVAGSQSRSYHSYGIAIDILPKSLDGKETYWQWAAEKGKAWWSLPYEDRYHPPDTVIKAFESYGFVWGGKWPYFDTMHFEYRPEVFILGGMELRSI